MLKLNRTVENNLAAHIFLFPTYFLVGTLLVYPLYESLVLSFY